MNPPAAGFAFRLSPRGGLQPLAPQRDAAGLFPPSPWRVWRFDCDGELYHACGALHGRSSLARRCGLGTQAADEALLTALARQRPQDWPRQLTGPWVLAGWSPAAGRLRLWRDASGLLPLYHACDEGGTVSVDTQLDRLAARLGCRPGGTGLHAYLHLLDIAPPHTVYPRIQALGAGEGLIWETSARRWQPWQMPADANGEPAALDEAAALAQLRQHLGQAVAACLEGAKRPAVFLSSGIDSALICALAARERPDLTAVTVGFAQPELDEAPRAAAIARHLGVRHVVWRYDLPALGEALLEHARWAEQPMADPALPASLLAFRDAAAHFDVVLDGTGADELLGAMPPRHLRLAVAWASRLPRRLRRLAARTAGRLPGGYAAVFDFDHPAEVLRRWKGFSTAEIAALCGGPVDLQDSAFYRAFARHPRRAHYARYSDLYNAMPCDRLSHCARLTGLDVRFPYWWPTLAAWLRRLPLHLRWRPDSAKHLLRRLLAEHVPAALWAGPKRGFDPPLRALLTYDDHVLVRRHLLDAGGVLDGLLARDEVQRHVQRFLAGDPHGLFRIWALVVLSAWLQAHAPAGAARPVHPCPVEEPLC